MTLGTCIQRADALRPNACTEQEKERWVMEVEGELREDFLSRYEDVSPVVQTSPGDRTAPLAASGPFEALYIYRLLARIELADQEWESYNAYNALANQALSEFKKAWHRTHRAKPSGR